MTTNEEQPDQAITAEEYQRQLAAQEEEANLVFGGDDGKECTYGRSDTPRQAVFSCVTCTPQGEAGFCLACSIHCHDGHEVLEIYTKRNFRCDCGNSKFPNNPCKLTPQKDPLNDRNSYNQNFTGLYCTCHRPYPDPERDDDIGETMFQCIVCEDWLHEEHLGLRDDEEVPTEDDEASFDEIICQACVNTRCTFLSAYPELQVEPVRTAPELPSHSPSDADTLPRTNGVNSRPAAEPRVSETAVELGAQAEGLLSGSNTRSGPFNSSSGVQSDAPSLPPAALALITELARIQAPGSVSLPGSNSGFDLGGSNSGPRAVSDPAQRPLGDPPARTSFAAFNALLRGEESRSGQTLANAGNSVGAQRQPSERVETQTQPDADTCPPTRTPAAPLPNRAVFLVRDWRERLCQCPACTMTYADARVTFLLDPEDTVAAYEERGRAREAENPSITDSAENSLDGFMQSMPRVQQLEMIQGYHDMATRLREYLAPFARSGATVTEADVQGFFEQLRSKRRRLE